MENLDKEMANLAQAVNNQTILDKKGKYETGSLQINSVIESWLKDIDQENSSVQKTSGGNTGLQKNELETSCFPKIGGNWYSTTKLNRKSCLDRIESCLAQIDDNKNYGLSKIDI